MHQTQSWSILHRILAYKSTPNAIMKYLISNFYLKKVTTYSEKRTCKTKNFTPYNNPFTPNLFFFTKTDKFYTRH